MSNCDKRLLQLSNTSLGAVPSASFIPLGTVTRQIKRDISCTPTFVTTTNVTNTVYVQEPGFYRITYTGSLTVEDVGTISVDLQINGTTVSTATVTAGAVGTYPVSLSFVTRVFKNCCTANNLPIQIQLLNSGVALTGGSGTFILERSAS